MDPVTPSPAPAAAGDLTRRQRAVYETLLRIAREGGDAPTLDELCGVLGLRSRGSMHKHVQALVDAGLVQSMHGRQRGVRLAAQPAWRAAAPTAAPTTAPAAYTGAATEPGDLPLLGRIAAGHPIEAVLDGERIQVPPALRGRGRCYVLEVRGDSMIEAGILDGDWVVVEGRDSARDGELVVALIDEESATLKRIEQRRGQCILHPANATHEPQVYAPQRVRVQGVVVGQMRRYR